MGSFLAAHVGSLNDGVGCHLVVCVGLSDGSMQQGTSKWHTQGRSVATWVLYYGGIGSWRLELVANRSLRDGGPLPLAVDLQFSVVVAVAVG